MWLNFWICYLNGINLVVRVTKHINTDSYLTFLDTLIFQTRAIPFAVVLLCINYRLTLRYFSR